MAKITTQIYMFIIVYFIKIVVLYVRNKSKKICKLNNITNQQYIYEMHSLSYTLLIILTKLGFFGHTPNIINKNIYKQLSKYINNKTNKLFKDDNECIDTIIQYMIDNKFTNDRKFELLNKQLNIKNYPTLNSFFIREIDMNLRNKIIPCSNNSKLYSPADSRTRFLLCKDNLSFKIKGKQVLLADIGFIKKKCDIIMISRLISSDYHRFHSPVTGRIINIKEIKTDMSVSVNELVIPEFNPYTLNSRKIVTIVTKRKQIIEICFVGATFVNDIVINKKCSDFINAGDELGYFKLGSCIVTKLTNIELNDKIKFKKEYYIQVKDELGCLL